MSLMPRSFILCLCLLFACLPTLAQTKTDAELDDEAKRANELYQQAQALATLGMYQDLHTQRPTAPVYTERLAMAYIAKSGTDTSPQEASADRNTARKLFKEAQAQGDHSDLVQVMMEKLGDTDSAPAAVSSDDPRAPGGAFAQAELLFNKGDLQGAIALYGQSWQKFPTFYSAPLYAGDSEYKLGHYDQAGVWFARAIAINNDAETAHRYWADCLMKAGRPEQARDQYILAFIASPYEKAPRLSLRAWANAQHIRYIPPPITLPAPPTTSVGKDGKTNTNIRINFDPKKKDDPLAPSWLMYSMNSALWQGDKFKKQFPNEKVYRHSLAEEVESIHGLLTGLRELKVKEFDYDATIRNLMALDKDNMLECWILLDAPDNGTAQDYVAYRAAHRDLLRAYIARYDLHPG